MAGIGAYFIHGKSQRDLMTWPKDEEPEATADAAFALLKGISAKRKDSK